MARIIATAGVRLTLSDKGFATSVRNSIRNAVKEARVQVEADLDTARMRAQLAAATRGATVNVGVNLDTNLFTRTLNQLGSMAARGLRLNFTLAGAAGALQTISGLVAAVGQLSGALGLLPAVAVAGGAAIGALAIGMQGFGDALSNMGDPAKFAEALKGLSPSARAAAVAIRDMKPAWESLQLTVQEALFKNMGRTIQQLGKAYLPVLRTGLAAIAGELNRGATLWAQWAAQGKQVQAMRTILDNTRSAMSALAPAGRDFAAALTDITVVGSGFLPMLAQSLANAAANFRDFIASARESGQLQQWIQSGITAFQQLWQIIKNVAVILGEFFAAFNAEGAGILSVLAQLTGQLRTFLQSAEGQSALQELARTLGTVAAQGARVFQEAMKQLGPILSNIGPAVRELATTIGSVLVKGLEIVGPALANLARFLSDNASWLAPVATGIGAVAIAFRVLTAAMAANPFIAIATAVVALVTLIITHWDTIKAALLAAWNWIKTTAETVWNAIVSFLRGVWEGFVGFYVGIWDGIVAYLTNLWTGIQILAQTVWQTIVDFLRGVWEGFSGFFIGIWDGIVSFVTGIWNGIAEFASKVWGSIDQEITGFLTGIGNFFRNAWNNITRTVSEAWTVIRTAVSNGVDNVLTFFRNLPGNIVSALGNLGRLLWNAGRDILNGLWEGLKSMWETVKGWVGNIAGWIADLKGPISYDRRLLIPAGNAIMEGLGQGLAEGFVPVENMVSRMGDQLVDAFGEPQARGRVQLTGPNGILPDNLGAAQGVASSQPVTFQQFNQMLPGTDVRQFADTVLQRGMNDLSSGASSLSVQRHSVQIGVNDQLVNGVTL